MRVKKTVWTFCMLLLAAVLVLIVNSRMQLTSEVVMGGSDSVFVETDDLSAPMDDYDSSTELSDDKYVDLSFPDIDINNWRYTLINEFHPSSSYTPNLIRYESGITFETDASVSLNSLMAAAREAGFDPYIAVGYRSYADQQLLFNEKALSLTENGAYTYAEAQEITAELIARAGTSDHQTGLGVDIMDKEYEILDYEKMDAEFFAWLNEHCAEYGFIQRYPLSKKSVTGRYEPWHYRFVGIEAAKFITENGLCLEEFVAHYS